VTRKDRGYQLTLSAPRRAELHSAKHLERVFVTGVTGLIGSHVVYELLRQRLNGQGNTPIYVGARRGYVSPQEAVWDALFHDEMPDYLQCHSVESCKSWIKVIEMDLHDENLEQQLRGRLPENTTVIHSAASTNLSSRGNAEAEVLKTNYQGTLRLLNAVESTCSKFVFISTAFSCGARGGEIGDDYLNAVSGQHRNPYEKSKLRLEREFSERCEEAGIEWQILRPGVVGGRLLDAPLAFTSKFDVFYGLARFLCSVTKTSEQDLRILANPESSLNILPVDYVAKAIVRAVPIDNLKQLNLVHSKAVTSDQLLETFSRELGLDNCHGVPAMPEDLNSLEKLYYDKVGHIFSPYLCTTPSHYDTRNLRSLMHDIPEPNLTERLPELLRYAAKRDFVSFDSEKRKRQEAKAAAKPKTHLRVVEPIVDVQKPKPYALSA
jgi:nucleoside-diphosphate-sugar epimerase